MDQTLAVLVVVTFFKTKKIRFEKHEQRYDCNAWMVISFSVSTNVIVDLSYSEFSGALHHIFFLLNGARYLAYHFLPYQISISRKRISFRLMLHSLNFILFPGQILCWLLAVLFKDEDLFIEG